MDNSKAPLYVKKLNPNARLPTKGTPFAAGYDIYSAEDSVVPAHGKAIIKSGISIAVPTGNYGRVAPRSGLAVKNFIDTGAGVIDEDYRGEVGVVLFNHSDKDFEVKIGDRVAQLIIEKITNTEIVETDQLDDTLRGAGGFGSTGVRDNGQSESNPLKRNATEAGLPDKIAQISTENGTKSIDDDEWQEKSIIQLASLHAENKISHDDKKKLAKLVFQGNKAVHEALNGLNDGKSTLESLVSLGNL